MKLEAIISRLQQVEHVRFDNCRRTVETNAEAFRKLSRSLALAGSEVRLKILFLLEEEKELCPCDLSDILGMSTPAISQHLRKLKACGSMCWSHRTNTK